jgi:hypothetical protein
MKIERGKLSSYRAPNQAGGFFGFSITLSLLLLSIYQCNTSRSKTPFCGFVDDRFENNDTI